MAERTDRPEGDGPSRFAAGGNGQRRMRFERDSLAQVLRLVRSGEASTRQEIETVSGLGRAVVADRIATLIARGLVEEGDFRESTGGRAPRQVLLRAAAGHVLVGSVGTTTLGVGIADLSGRLLVEHHEPADITQGPEPTVDRLRELFEWMLVEHPEALPTWGIGLAVPGPVELAGGRFDGPSRLHMAPDWRDYPIRERLSETFRAPVWVDSEVHLMALGELHAGRGAGRDSMLFLKIGTGIGAALCADGLVHRGARGHAGDIGHVVIDPDLPVICRCGNTGCLEALAGGAAIAREGNLAAREGRSPYLAEILASGRAVTAADVGMAAHRGDQASVELLSQSGRRIGETLATLVNAYNPALVVVGGGVAQAGEILLAAMREAVFRRSRSLATQDLLIASAEMGKTAGLVGAALAVVDVLFAWNNLRAWIEEGSPVDYDWRFDVPADRGGRSAPNAPLRGGRRRESATPERAGGTAVAGSMR